MAEGDLGGMANWAAPEPPSVPSLVGRWVHLRPVVPADYPGLYAMATSPGQGYRWRFRGGLPSFDDFVRTIGQGVFLQYLVESNSDRSALGLAVCYNADFRNNHAYIALQASARTSGKGYALEGGRLLLDYLFSCYDFEKIYAESPEFVIDSFQSGIGARFVEEGRLRNHERFMGRYWDLYVFAYY
ncbi:MAG: GNAT family N-acetyltransferase, partial [Acidimicrobiales bacterium]